MHLRQLGGLNYFMILVCKCAKRRKQIPKLEKTSQDFMKGKKLAKFSVIPTHEYDVYI